MNGVVDYILEVFLSTIIQMTVLFGPLLATGFLIAFLEKTSNKMLMRMFSFKAVIYSTGWLGTTVHESGHALFCLIFGHKITAFVPFRPEPNESGGYTLGYVQHTSKGNIWNNVGYLFIGTGPIILGSTIIALLIRFLLPGGEGFFSELHSSASTLEPHFKDYFVMFWETVKITFHSVFWQNRWETFTSLRFWVFWAVSSMISLHMSLSGPDLRSAWKGAGIIAAILLMANIVLVLVGKTGFTNYISTYLMLFAGILFVGVLLSLLTMVLIFTFSAVVGKIKR